MSFLASITLMKTFHKLSIIVSLIISSFILYVGLKHNSQGEFYTSDMIDYIYIAKIFISWFILIYLILYIFRKVFK